MSARGVFIAGTDTGVGKTRITVALLQALSRRGVVAAGMKPVATGIGANAGTDAGPANEDVALIRAASSIAPTADINPYCFDWPVSPHLAARRAGITIEPATISAAYTRLASGSDVVVVEGTGGWLAPIGERATMADVAVALALPVVLVVGLRLGCLSHALLSSQAIEACGLPLMGWIGSVIDPSMQGLAENIGTLEQLLPARRLALLPFLTDRTEDALHVAALAAAVTILPIGGSGGPPATRRRPPLSR